MCPYDFIINFCQWKDWTQCRGIDKTKKNKKEKTKQKEQRWLEPHWNDASSDERVTEDSHVGYVEHPKGLLCPGPIQTQCHYQMLR